MAALPILTLLGLMLGPRWAAHKAGPASLLVGVLTAAVAFGLTPAVWWVSQARGVLLALFVLAVLWPALLLYNIIDRAGGIRAIADGMQSAIADRGLLLVLMAWAFSGFLEGLAGFGLPVAVVSPMLVALGVAPVLAVASVAVGHAWSVTFGDMGVIFQTLTGVSGMDPAELAGPAAMLLGAACLACGLAAARLLGAGRLWASILLVGVVMALAQYGLAVAGLVPLAALGAGLAGMGAGLLLGRNKAKQPIAVSPKLGWALGSYGALTLLLTAVAWPGPLREMLYSTVWQAQFPEVRTLAGFVTPAGGGTAFRFFVHPGTYIFLASLLTFAVYRQRSLCVPGDLRAAASATWRGAAPASLGIIATVCLSTLMEHAGMTQLLAQGAARLMGSAFPLVSPLVGMLGAFATGSNNNSNVLFAPMQKTVAALLAMDPRLLLAAQTTGGALGSMIAPAKIAVGCSTVGMKGREGDVLRRTVLYGLAIGLLMGGLALLSA